MPPAPTHVPFVRFQLHRSMCYGCANGTETKITNRSHLNGWSASPAKKKKKHCGRKAGYLLNPKNTCNRSTHTMDMECGKISNTLALTNMLALPSRWTPHRPTTTNAARSGCLGYASTPRRWLFAGLVALAKHTTTPAKVTVQLTSVWEAWRKSPHRHPYPDLLAEVTAAASPSSTSAATPGPQTPLATSPNFEGASEMRL